MLVTNYNTASEFCASLGGYLAMIKDGGENRLILDELLVGNGEYISFVFLFPVPAPMFLYLFQSGWICG